MYSLAHVDCLFTSLFQLESDLYFSRESLLGSFRQNFYEIELPCFLFLVNRITMLRWMHVFRADYVLL